MRARTLLTLLILPALLIGCRSGDGIDVSDEVDELGKRKPPKPDAGTPPDSPPPPDAPPPPDGPPPSTSCSGQTDPVLAMTSSPLTGTTSGANADRNPYCGNLGSGLPDVEVQLDLPELLTFQTHLDGGFFVDTSLNFARCGGGFAGWGSCNSNLPSGDSGWGMNHVPAGKYHLVVFTGDPAEPFTLTVSGVIQPNGRCDVPLAASGALACAPGTTCNGTSCVSAAGECGDGIDNDGDGKNGYPDDPGCSSITDPTEVDDCPSGPGCAACANLVDEDGDGFAGYPTDPGCASPGDLDESDECQTFPLNCPACSNQYDDDYDDRYDMDDPSCGFAGWNSEWPEY